MEVRAKRSAGFVVVRLAADGPRFLVLRAYKLWDFPKGLIDAGESPLAAAYRETREETGIDDLELRWGEDYAETAPYSGNKIARYYLGHTRTEHVVLHVNPVLGRPEHHEYRWVDAAEAADLLPARLQSVFRWAVETVGA
jgi:8-oxo-dGTP pyrophosphatase MutT (NUDIX family)